MTSKEEQQRVKEFMKCLSSGKTIYQYEAENDLIDEVLEEEENRQ